MRISFLRGWLLGLTVLTCANAAAEPVCVVRSKANLHRQPSAKSSVSWKVPKYMPLFRIDTKGAWSKVQDLDGEVHWIASRAISKKISCAVVRTKTAKLRKGPGSNAPLADLASVDKYTPFMKVDRDGEWIQVRDDYNGQYWVNETNVWIPMSRTRVSF